MRFIVESVKLDKTHPLWPDETVYYFVEVLTGKRSLGCYTTVETALEMAKRRERRELNEV
jgi:hypothetical protein